MSRQVLSVHLSLCVLSNHLLQTSQRQQEVSASPNTYRSTFPSSSASPLTVEHLHRNRSFSPALAQHQQARNLREPQRSTRDPALWHLISNLHSLRCDLGAPVLQQEHRQQLSSTALQQSSTQHLPCNLAAALPQKGGVQQSLSPTSNQPIDRIQGPH